MDKLILLIHIALAVLSLAYAGLVVLKTRKNDFKVASAHAKKMWYGTLATIITGAGLAFVAKAPIGRVCISSFVLLVVIYAAHYYKRSHQLNSANQSQID